MYKVKLFTLDCDRRVQRKKKGRKDRRKDRRKEGRKVGRKERGRMGGKQGNKEEERKLGFAKLKMKPFLLCSLNKVKHLDKILLLLRPF